jgi:hypothetical protein
LIRRFWINGRFAWLTFGEFHQAMLETMDRRSALASLFFLPSIFVAMCAGCDRDPNQRVNGTMVKPIESIENRDELRAKKADAEREAKKKNNTKKKA